MTGNGNSGNAAFSLKAPVGCADLPGPAQLGSPARRRKLRPPPEAPVGGGRALLFPLPRPPRGPPSDQSWLSREVRPSLGPASPAGGPAPGLGPGLPQPASRFLGAVAAAGHRCGRLRTVDLASPALPVAGVAARPLGGRCRRPPFPCRSARGGRPSRPPCRWA